MSFTIVTDADNKHHFLYKQEKPHSCGMACAAMMIHRIKGRVVQEKDLRRISKTQPRGYKSEGSNGVYLDGLVPLLAEYKINLSYKSNLDWETLGYIAQDNKPLIAFLARNDGSYHLIFIDGISSYGSAVVLDPDGAIGHKVQYLQKDRFPKYQNGKLTGHFVYPLVGF